MLPKKNAAMPARRVVVRAGTCSSKWHIVAALCRRAPPYKRDTFVVGKANATDMTEVLAKQ